MTVDPVVAQELTGPELVERYLSERYESKHSRYIREKHLLNFDAQFGLRAASRIDGRKDVEAWISRPSINQRTTRNSYLSELHSFYEWAFVNRLLPIDPTVGIERRQHKPAPPRAISPEDLAAAVQAADPVMRAWLLLASGAGCTVQEIAALTPSDVLDQTDVAIVADPRQARAEGHALFLSVPTSSTPLMRHTQMVWAVGRPTLKGSAERSVGTWVALAS